MLFRFRITVSRGNAFLERHAAWWAATALALAISSFSVFAEEKPGGPTRVALSGQVVRASVPEGKPLHFVITIENRSETPIKDIRLERIDPWEFHEIPGSISVPAGNVCQAPASRGARSSPRQTPPAASVICAYLAPHQAFAFWGDLKADEPVSRQNAFAVLRWESLAGGSVGSVSLGEVESLERIRWIWYLLLHEWELGVPTLVAFLGGLVAGWKWFWVWRGKKAAELADKRSKTWNLMLRDSHRTALRYYMPIATAVNSLIREMKRFRESGSTDLDTAKSAFYYLLKFHWEIRRTRRELGAYYFKNRLAEGLVYDLFDKHSVYFGAELLRINLLLEPCLDLMSVDTTVEDIVGMITAGVVPVDGLWDHFRVWLGRRRSQADSPVLEAYLGILVYEANRPYQHWYGNLEPLELSAEARRVVTGLARRIKPKKDRIEREKNTKAYLKEASKR
jgi:hypothetical protein